MQFTSHTHVLYCTCIVSFSHYILYSRHVQGNAEFILQYTLAPLAIIIELNCILSLLEYIISPFSWRSFTSTKKLQGIMSKYKLSIWNRRHFATYAVELFSFALCYESNNWSWIQPSYSWHGALPCCTLKKLLPMDLNYNTVGARNLLLSGHLRLQDSKI